MDLAKARDTTQMGLFETWMKAFCSLPFDLPYSNYGNGMRAHRELKKEIIKLFAAQRQIRAANGNEPTSSGSIVVDMMLMIQQDLEEKGEEDIHLDDEELMDTLLIFLMAGHETGIWFKSGRKKEIFQFFNSDHSDQRYCEYHEVLGGAYRYSGEAERGGEAFISRRRGINI